MAKSLDIHKLRKQEAVKLREAAEVVRRDMIANATSGIELIILYNDYHTLMGSADLVERQLEIS